MLTHRLPTTLFALLIPAAFACSPPPSETPDNHPPTIDTLTASTTLLAQGGTARLEITASDPDGDPITYSWEVDGEGYFILPDFNPRMATLQAAEDAAGAQGVITATATDAHGATATTQLTVSTNANRAPALERVVVDPPGPFEPLDTFQVQVIATDPDADPLAYAFAISEPWILNSNDNVATLTAPATYGETAQLHIQIDDSGGGTVSTQLELSTRDNRPPLISLLEATPLQPQPGSTVTLTAEASDPDEHALTWTWSASDPNWVLDTTTTPGSATLTAPADFGVEGVIELTVDDGFGGTDQKTVQLATQTSSGPIIESLTANPRVVARGDTVELLAAATDPDGGPLRYFWRSTNFEWTVAGNDDTATVTSPDRGSASASIELTVLDEENLSAKASLLLSTHPNQPPRITLLEATNPTPAPGSETQLNIVVEDPEDDPIEVLWSVSPSTWVVVGPNASGTRIFAPLELSDTATVTAIARDDLGDSDQRTLQLNTSNTCPAAHVTASGTCVPCDQTLFIRDHPIIQYRLNDAPGSTEAFDESGHNRHGHLNAGVTLGYGTITDDGGTSAHLDGTATMTLPSFAAFPRLAVSIEFWLRTQDRTAQASLFQYGIATQSRELALDNPSALTFTVGGASLETGVDVADGTWHNLVLTWRSIDGTTTLYVDGIEHFTDTHQMGYSLGDLGALTLGDRYTGIIDEFAFYKIDLTPTQIAHHLAAFTCGELCNGVDDDGDGTTDEGFLGSDSACPAPSCDAITNANAHIGPATYWLDSGQTTCF